MTKAAGDSQVVVDEKIKFATSCLDYYRRASTEGVQCILWLAKWNPSPGSTSTKLVELVTLLTQMRDRMATKPRLLADTGWVGGPLQLLKALDLLHEVEDTRLVFLEETLGQLVFP